MKQQAQPLSLFHVFFSLNTNQGAAESFGYYSTEKIFSSSFLVSSSWLQFLLVVFAWKEGFIAYIPRVVSHLEDTIIIKATGEEYTSGTDVHSN